MRLKLLPPPRVWQKTAPVFGGRTVPRPLPHHPTDPRHLWGKILSQGGNYYGWHSYPYKEKVCCVL